MSIDIDAHVVVHAAGAHTAPVPLAETIVAGWLLAGAGLEVPLGPLAFAPVHGAERLQLTRTGGGWRLSGQVTRVPWGVAASHVVAMADGDGRAMVALVAGGTAASPAITTWRSSRGTRSSSTRPPSSPPPRRRRASAAGAYRSTARSSAPPSSRAPSTAC